MSSKNMTKKQVQTFFERLREQRPTPQTELNYSSPFELLIAVMLSAQATDVSVNKATDKLFPIANTAQSILNLGVEGLKSYIKTIGLYNSKAEKGTDGVKEGISDVIGKVKDKVKGVDRDKIKKINLKINALVDKDREAQAKLKAAEQNDSLSDEEFDKKESFYNEVMANIGKEISQLKDALKKARAGRRG